MDKQQNDEFLKGLAGRVAAVCEDELRPAAFILTGSAADGHADLYSDLDLIVYHHTMPAEPSFARVRERLGAENLQVLGPYGESHYMEDFWVDGVEMQLANTTVAAWEEQLAEILVRHTPGTLTEKALQGVQKCIALAGEDLVAGWRRRIDAYPDGLAVANARHYLSFFPLWYYRDRFHGWDADIFRRASLVENAQNLLGVLAAVNRKYYTSFQLKRQTDLIDSLEESPARLSERLQQVFGADMDEAADEMQKLVSETLTIVERRLPEVDTAGVRRRLDQRQTPRG